MNTLYVIGPVVRAGAKYGPHIPFYNELRAECDKLGISIQLPFAEPELEALLSSDFREVIAKRIDDADAVLTYFASGDASGAVESALAALGGKRQVIFTDGAVDAVPRLLRGLPGVLQVLPSTMPEAINEGLTLLREDIEASEPALAG